MTNEQAKQILEVLPRFELVDVTVVTTDGRRANGFAVYTQDGGDLQTAPFIWEKLADKFANLNPQEGFEEHTEAIVALMREISEDCWEAANYQRDLLRGKN